MPGWRSWFRCRRFAPHQQQGAFTQCTGWRASITPPTHGGDCEYLLPETVQENCACSETYLVWSPKANVDNVSSNCHGQRNSAHGLLIEIAHNLPQISRRVDPAGHGVPAALALRN